MTRCGALRISAWIPDVPRAASGKLQRPRNTPSTITNEINTGESPAETSLVGTSAAPSHAPLQGSSVMLRILEDCGKSVGYDLPCEAAVASSRCDCCWLGSGEDAEQEQPAFYVGGHQEIFFYVFVAGRSDAAGKFRVSEQ